MMKLNRIALAAAMLALGVAACGDDVQVVEPAPPVPPPPPPVEATMAPASASVLIGNSVVFAVNASGGVAGDAASWTCNTSNSGIASVSVVSAGCQATGVAAGSVTVTATVTKSGETVNVGAQLTVTEEAAGEPAFVILASVKDSTEDDDTLSGRVTATVNVERGDQELEEVALLVDGEVVSSQSFGAAMTAADDDAAEQAVHAFTLSFNTAAYDDHGHPDYMNGEHTISAEVEIGVDMADGTHGHQTISSNVQTVEFDNDDAVHVSMSGLGDGALNTTTGQVWHGGPDAEIKITALPVLYSGGAAATAVTLSAFCGADAATDAEEPYEFTPKCAANHVSPAIGDKPSFSISGTKVDKIIGTDALFLDFKAPGAPTFVPNPNGREGGWINAAVGITSTSGKDAWLKAGDADTGVGGYLPQLRYAAKPKSGKHQELALDAAATTSLPAESKGVTPNTYCVFASATDRLGNESALPKKADATCEEVGAPRTAGDDEILGTADDVMGSGYKKLMVEAGITGDNAIAGAEAKLANAGLLAGVDLTPPQIEFLAASAKDKATSLGAAGGTVSPWAVHVADRIGELHSDTLAVSIKVRDAKETTTFKKRAEAPAADSFYVSSSGYRHTITVLGSESANVRDGYYSFSAKAKDAAGNESAPVSRVALHDGTMPTAPALYLIPSGSGYNSTLVLQDSLSIKSYSTAVVLPNIPNINAPRLIAESAKVDEYNAATLTTSKTVTSAVNLPYKAIQIGNDPGGTPAAINNFTATVTDQAGTTVSPAENVTIPVPITGIDAVTFRTGGNALTVTPGENTTLSKDSTTVTVTVTADMEDNVDNLDAPFSAVGLYAQATVGEVQYLRYVGVIPGAAATTKITNDGREWEYETKLNVDAVWEVVKDTKNSESGNYTGRIAAFGVAEDGKLVVVDTSGGIITISGRK